MAKLNRAAEQIELVHLAPIDGGLRGATAMSDVVWQVIGHLAERNPLVPNVGILGSIGTGELSKQVVERVVLFNDEDYVLDRTGCPANAKSDWLPHGGRP